MAAAQHQRGGGLCHPRYQLRDAESRLNIAAHGVQQQQQAVHIVLLLHRRQQRQNMFIFGGLYIGRQGGVALDLTDDGQAMDRAPLVLDHRGAHFDDLLLRCVAVLILVAVAAVHSIIHGFAPSFLP